MAKTSGLGMTLAVDNDAGGVVTITNDVNSITFSTPQGLQDITGLDKSAIERIILLADGQVSMTGTFNAALSHTVFESVPTTSVTRTVTITHSSQILAMEMLPTEYVVNRAQDGSLVWTAALQLANGTVPVWTT